MIMEIFIEDIPSDGMTIKGSDQDSWVKEIVNNIFAENFHSDDTVNLELNLTKVDSTINVIGTINLKYHPACDRCLNEFSVNKKISVTQILLPVYENERQKDSDEKELAIDDVNMSFYEGDQIDVSDLVHEQIILSLPMKNICKDECAGICQHCGKDLNEGPCECKDDNVDPRWAALADMKEAKK